MTPAEALGYAEAYMLRGERPRVDLEEVVRVLRGAVVGAVWEMPPRQPEDGPVGVRRFRDGHLAIDCGGGMECVVSDYNAARIMGMLSMFLEFPLPAGLGALIQLVPPGVKLDMIVDYPKPKTLGERLAQELMPDRIGDFVKVRERSSKVR